MFQLFLLGKLKTEKQNKIQEPTLKMPATIKINVKWAAGGASLIATGVSAVIFSIGTSLALGIATGGLVYYFCKTDPNAPEKLSKKNPSLLPDSLQSNLSKTFKRKDN